MSKNFQKLISATDIYGWPIKLNYRGDNVYKTLMGSCCSLVTYAVIIFNFTTLFMGFLEGSKQSESQQTLHYDRFLADGFNLRENLFEISIFRQSIPPELGRLRMTYWNMRNT